MPEPRFINPHDRVVYVNRPDGHQIVVRPFRELGVIVGRQEKDCVMEGEHYRQFGQLIPFPEDAPSEEAPAVDGGDVDSVASPGRFGGKGDVISPDGTVKTETQGDGSEEPPEPDVDVNEDDLEETEDDDGEDIDPTPLEDVDGVGPKVASQLREVGIETANDLADKQEEHEPGEIADACPGIRNAAHATQLIEAAQELLGYEDGEDEDED